MPGIRKHVAAQLWRRTLDRDRVLAGMVSIIDLSAIRIGTEEYAEDNDSFGLSTLTKRHVRLRPGRAEFSFPAKSGRRVEISISERPVVRLVRDLVRRRGRQLFAVDRDPVTAADVNAFLVDLTGSHITAKDFRTWHGTRAAFEYLRQRGDSTRPLQSIAIDAVDQAAELLGNTRAVARAHYVHPHLIESFTEDRFDGYLRNCTVRRSSHLDTDECMLRAFLHVLLDREFNRRRLTVIR